MVNHIPIKVLKYITLSEAWGKIKFDVSHLCEFGSDTWSHIFDEKGKAL